MAVPAGVIIAWPGAVADIPAGWDRVAALDGRFPRGNTTAVATGGASTHTHATGTPHRHWTEDHSHAAVNGSVDTSGTTEVVVTIQLPGKGRLDALVAAAAHTHTFSLIATVPGAQTLTDYASVTLTSASSLPLYTDVIWIESDGTPDGIPDGAVTFAQAVPTDWSVFETGRYLRGATVGANGGGTGGAASHSHMETAEHTHTHSQSSHSHVPVTAVSSAYAGTIVTQKDTGGNAAVILNHWHYIYNDPPLSPVALLPATSISDTVAIPNPYHCSLWAARNDTGGDDYPTEIICIWLGALIDIPSGWVICNGAGGTPTLNDRVFARNAAAGGEIGVHAGGNTHTHTSLHMHSSAPHTHPLRTGNSYQYLMKIASGPYHGMKRHTHNISTVYPAATLITRETSPLIGTKSADPPWHDVIFIKLVTVPPHPQQVAMTEQDPDGVVIAHIDTSLPGFELVECDTIIGHDMGHFVPGNAPWASLEDVTLSVQSFGPTIVTAVIPDTPGDCHIVSANRRNFNDDGGATVIAGTWASVALEKMRGEDFLLVLLLEGDGGTPEVFRWHQSVGLWDPGTSAWDFTAPIECDTDPTGSFPDALVGSNGSVRRMSDGGFIFAMIDDAEDMRVFRAPSLLNDGSGTWAEV